MLCGPIWTLLFHESSVALFWDCISLPSWTKQSYPQPLETSLHLYLIPLPVICLRCVGHVCTHTALIHLVCNLCCLNFAVPLHAPKGLTCDIRCWGKHRLSAVFDEGWGGPKERRCNYVGKTGGISTIIGNRVCRSANQVCLYQPLDHSSPTVSTGKGRTWCSSPRSLIVSNNLELSTFSPPPLEFPSQCVHLPSNPWHTIFVKNGISKHIGCDSNCKIPANPVWPFPWCVPSHGGLLCHFACIKRPQFSLPLQISPCHAQP